MKVVKRGTKSIRKKIFQIIDAFINKNEFEYDCADNYRYAEIGNKDEEETFKIICENGCCGSYESEIEFENKIYKIGFNYGH